MVLLETKGFETLTPETKIEFEKLWEEHSKKIERKLNGTQSIKIHLKEHNKGGKTRFTITALTSYSGKSLEANAEDWDLRKAFHKVFNKIEEEIEHLFHVSNQNRKR